MSTDPRPAGPSGRRGSGYRRPRPSDVLRHQPGRRPPMPRSSETSAGGLVVDIERAEAVAALIGRLDRRGRVLWSLPKGHVETGETREQAAVREVQEETGIVGTILAPLGSVRYWFVADGRRVHKTVHHYLMRAIEGELSDEDAEVVAVDWVPLSQLRRRLAYADERRIVEAALRMLEQSA